MQNSNFAVDFRNDVLLSEPARSPDFMIFFATRGRAGGKIQIKKFGRRPVGGR